MKIAGKITLPYPFCLLLAALGLVGLMCGVIAWETFRDMRASEPRRADEALARALDAVTHQLAGHFEPVKTPLADVQRWVAGGIVPEDRPQNWPALLLPAFATIDHISYIQVLREGGATWLLERDGQGWIGRFSETPGGATPTGDTRWADDGTRQLSVQTEARRRSPVMSAWDQGSRIHPVGPGPQIHTTLPDAADTTMTLSVPVRFADGHQGMVAVGVQCGDLLTRIAGGAGDGVRIQLDAGGRAVLQVQDQETLALLQQQAIPAANNTGLDVLFARIRKGQEEPWYGARRYDVGAAPAGYWWVLGSIDGAQLPPPPLSIGRYLLHGLAVGALAALVLAWFLGRMIVRPLRQVAVRAQTIQSLDEHYLPWPKSPFTEVNALTVALEDLYDTAVEHLDYHDAPLVVWAESESDGTNDAIEAEAVRHVMRVPRGVAKPVETAESGLVIDVEGARELASVRDTAAAVQIQVLQGSRREVRRLQGQLAGAFEALRTTEAHQRQAETRLKRQRTFLRSLEAMLQDEGAASPAALAGLCDVLGATRVSLWIQTSNPARFSLRLVSGHDAWAPCTLAASFRFRALLREEAVVNAQDGLNDPRLVDLQSTAFCSSQPSSIMLVPLRAAGQVLGFLLLEQHGAARRWKGDEELFLMTVAAQSASVLWQQLRKRAASGGPRIVASVITAPTGVAGVHPNGNGHSKGNGNGNGHGAGHSGIDGAHTAEDAPSVRWETDLAGCIKRVEGDVHAIYGRTADQLVGQPITFLSEARQGALDLDQYSLLLAGRPCRGYDTIHLTANGAEIQLNVRASVLHDGNGAVIGARGTVRCAPVAVPG